ncbi:MAG TPA: hypothetical protein PKA42_00100 [Candidatus Paceibacterota bacterium]|mgnify:CR=1 FL=1|nr:hypothetical protein [Candidatus Paceibacterota bacterium]HMO82548.1 hypothetical protein [Candidatus Paceibacterota bacterium]
MINLIPTTVRNAVIKEYWLRVLSVFLFIISVVAVVITLLFLPVYVLVSTQVEVYAESAKQAAERVADFDVSAKNLTDANQLAQKILEQKQVKNFSTIIKLVESLQTTGITINAIDLSRAGQSLGSVRVDGLAKTRNDLASFRDNLIQHESIADVILPISNLAKESDIEFTLAVVLNEVQP